MGLTIWEFCLTKLKNCVLTKWEVIQNVHYLSAFEYYLCAYSGGLSAAGDFILASARKSMVDFTTPALRDGLEIVQESSGNEAGMLGAGYLVFEQTGEVGSD